MAPGVGGNGGGNRQTGTVPKIKPHNELAREFNGVSRREYPQFNHMSNNLSSLDWQPVNDSFPHSRTRKESNTSASRYSEYDAEENTTPQENVWLNTGQKSQAYHSDDDEASQASWLESRYKSNNLGLPDKTQVKKRLTQIREYVSQTVSLMEGLRSSGGQRNMAQHEKLASMLEDLRDSEMKLHNLYERLQHIPTGQPQSLPPLEIESDHFPTHQMLDPPRERVSKSLSPVPNGSDSARKNELKKQVQLSQVKLQELQEQQAALKALRQKAQEQLKEAMEAQAVLSQHSQQPNSDNMIQERLHNLQRYFDTRNQMVHLAGLEEGEPDAAEMQSKLDDLQAKKQHMDQLLAQFSNLNSSNHSELASAEECEQDVEHKIAELNAMREQLALLQTNLSTQLQPRAPSQERVIKNEPRPFVEKPYASSSRAQETKPQQLSEARTKLQMLQSLLRTVEELRESGQPVPESVLQLITNQAESPTHPDRSDLSSQDMNMSQTASEHLNASELFTEQNVHSHNSCEREQRSKRHQAVKHNNQQGKLGAKMQLEELMRNQEMIMPQPLHSSSFHENGPVGAWGGSLDENYNPEYSSEVNESNSVKHVSSSNQPHNAWRKPSSGSGTSRYSWTSPYVPQEGRRVQSDNTPDSGPSTQPLPTHDLPPQPDTHWVVQQISQLQSQLQQMNSFYKNFVEKQHNCAPQWMPSNNISSPLGPYCQYIVSASQWQQQQLLVHSLNQCCQLIWHQQQELATLKEALRQLQQQPEQPDVHYPAHEDLPTPTPTPPSNLTQPSRPHIHTTLKPSLSAGPSLAPPTVVSSAHSLPNLSSPLGNAHTTVTSAPNNRNVLSPPAAAIMSLPPSLNNTAASQHNPNVFFNPSSHQFTDPNFINLYPPYGNNLNFEFPSPVNFFPSPPEPFLSWAAAASQNRPPTTLNNQVPPGNRANNYWDNFRSYSRQNLLSNRAKSNDGRLPLDRFLNTDPATLVRDQLHRCRKERLNAQSGQMSMSMSGGEVEREVEGDGVEGEVASGYQAHGAARQQIYGAQIQPLSYQHNLCSGEPCSSTDKTHVRPQVYSPHSIPHISNQSDSRSSSLTLENEQCPLPTSTRLVNDCEAPRGSNKKIYTQAHDAVSSSERKVAVNKRNLIQAEVPREGNLSQFNNYAESVPSHSDAEYSLGLRPINLVNTGCTSRKCRNPRNLNTMVESSSSNVQHNCIGEGHCLMASDKSSSRNNNKGNNTKDCKTDTNKEAESLEDCVYSEVAALISSNEWRPQFLLQLFKDLRLLSTCVDPNMQAALSSIHSLAARTIQDEQRRINEEASNSHNGVADQRMENSSQPRNWNHKDNPQLPAHCAKLDWEVRSILMALLPFVKTQISETCGPSLLEAFRKLILHLVPSQSTQDQLDAQLEDALHKFHGSRLGDVYEEVLTVVADVLISELTFLRLINTVNHNHSNGQPNGQVVVAQEEVEAEGEEEGAVGGIVDEVAQVHPPFLPIHPVNLTRRTKSETVSETDLVEADQPRHSNSGGEEERAENSEDVHSMEEEARGRDVSNNENETDESKTEANWAVEQDREMGLDQVPIRLHNPSSEEPETNNNSDTGIL